MIIVMMLLLCECTLLACLLAHSLAVKLLDYATSTITLVGRHETSSSSSDPKSNACSCLVSMATPGDDSGGEYANIIASASWNGQFCLWDVRQNSNSRAIATLELPGKAFSMDVDAAHHRVVVATAGRRNVVIDLKTIDGKIQPSIVLDRESSLKYQTRTIRFFPDGRGMALGSVEGRVGVEYLDELPNAVPNSSNKKYAFKCHRVNDTVYPVNCIAFHPRFTDTFATGGCDGSVVLWDGGNKKKVS
jgi:cell cycle arrest protein BUB3